MEEYERVQLGDCAKEENYEAGQIVIKQGDQGHQFYMIASGELEATRVD
jgi:CRP-like cAMP-binding protein